MKSVSSLWALAEPAAAAQIESPSARHLRRVELH
jgi:hypothetical protein